MSRISETIKFNNLDINLKISLGGNNDTIGSQQEIDNIVEITKQSLINPINDIEVRRFNYKPIIEPANLQFYFVNSNNEYANDFINAGFTTAEVSSISTRILNSFFILELYDSVDPNTQSRILSTYLTKILGGTNTLPNYSITNAAKNQFYYLNIPLTFINKQNSSTINVYAKYSFYNAKYSFYNVKDGGISLFYNKQNADNPSLNTTPEKMYFKIELDLINMTWSYITSNTYSPYGGYDGDNSTIITNIVAYELPLNSAYVTRINNTVSNFDDKQQIYPNGNVFDDKNGTYRTE